jgi:mono/diheme cytochrome c family protein
MKHSILVTAAVANAFALVAAPVPRALAEETTIAASAAGGHRAPASDLVGRGRYIVTVSGCNDCHTPWQMGPNGPEPDMTRMLSGHPQESDLPAPPALAGPWVMVAAATNTAFSGPWGVSFTANLTPDPETGLGRWTQRNFAETIRTGRHLGRGRPVLPPMPIPMYKNFTDADLEAIFAYLQSIPPVRNRVPEPLPPAENLAVAKQ